MAKHVTSQSRHGAFVQTKHGARARRLSGWFHVYYMLGRAYWDTPWTPSELQDYQNFATDWNNTVNVAGTGMYAYAVGHYVSETDPGNSLIGRVPIRDYIPFGTAITYDAGGNYPHWNYTTAADYKDRLTAVQLYTFGLTLPHPGGTRGTVHIVIITTDLFLQNTPGHEGLSDWIRDVLAPTSPRPSAVVIPDQMGSNWPSNVIEDSRMWFAPPSHWLDQMNRVASIPGYRVTDGPPS